MTAEQIKVFYEMKLSIQLMEKDVKWTKKKTSDMEEVQKIMAKNVSKLTGLLLKDDQIDSIGYIAVTRKLVKRVTKLETIKKAVIGSLFTGFFVIGWFLKALWSYVTK